MKCKYCGQTIDNVVDKKIKEKAIKMYCIDMMSLRDISKKLGGKISPSTISRIVREKLSETIKK